MDSASIEEPEGWPEDACYESLVGDWGIYQRKGGHRTSTDDVLTAWLANRCMMGQRPQRYLDLGCGIGSVLLMTSHATRPVYALGVEAQKQSAALAKASVQKLSRGDDIAIRQGDFRKTSIAESSDSFDLITGSPPYFPVGSGTMSQDYQRSACRFELRGGVEAYCEIAARELSPQGRFVMVFQSEWDGRVLEAADKVGLRLQLRADIVMREDRAKPFLSVYVFGREIQERVHSIGFAIRDAKGGITPEYRRARTELGLPTSR